MRWKLAPQNRWMAADNNSEHLQIPCAHPNGNREAIATIPKYNSPIRFVDRR